MEYLTLFFGPDDEGWLRHLTASDEGLRALVSLKAHHNFKWLTAHGAWRSIPSYTGDPIPFASVA